jgi:hypothetical protein
MTIPTRSVGDGGYTSLNIQGGAPINLITGRAIVFKVIVLVSAAAASSIIDSIGTSPSAANTILTIPASTAVGTIYSINWPCFTGLSIVPGSGVTLNVSYSEGAFG